MKMIPFLFLLSTSTLVTVALVCYNGVGVTELVGKTENCTGGDYCQLITIYIGNENKRTTYHQSCVSLDILTGSNSEVQSYMKQFVISKHKGGCTQITKSLKTCFCANGDFCNGESLQDRILDNKKGKPTCQSKIRMLSIALSIWYFGN